MLTSSLVLLLFPHLTLTMRLSVTPCGGNVIEVRGTGCLNETQPCVVQKGTTAHVEVDFIAPFGARYVVADVVGKTGSSFFPIYVPWLGFHRNACDGHGLTCPISRGRKYTYHYKIDVDPSYPDFKTEYTWKLTNAWGFVISCFSMPLELVSPPTTVTTTQPSVASNSIPYKL